MAGISVHIPQPKHVEVVDAYEPAHDPDLFLGQVGAVDRVLRSIRGSASALMAEIRDTEDPKLNDMLDDLVAAATGHEEWPHWRYRNEAGRAHRPRVFTPPYSQESYGAGVLLSRLLVVPATSLFVQSIIHIEKIRFGDGEPQTFSGQEIIWRPGSDQRPIMDIGTGSERLHVSPEHNNEFWQSAVYSVAAAHAEFVG